jgi:hypothetical protein
MKRLLIYKKNLFSSRAQSVLIHTTKRLRHNCLSYIKIQTILQLTAALFGFFGIGNEGESIASEIHSAFLRAAGEPPRAKSALRGLT